MAAFTAVTSAAMAARQSTGPANGEESKAEASVGVAPGDATTFETQPFPQTLHLFHFNDVYNVGQRDKEPVGGVARFAARVKEVASTQSRWAASRGAAATPGAAAAGGAGGEPSSNGGGSGGTDADAEAAPLVLFSGDALNPSSFSIVTKGMHMVDALNGLGLSAACVGNHDLDFGVENLERARERSNFPWLLSNCNARETGEPLAGALQSVLLRRQGVTVGLMGLIESDWLECLGAVQPEDVEYTDFVKRGTELAAELRKSGADIVIALTHMRVPNDTRLANEATGIDIILGGHDHHYEVAKINGVTLIKSGTDFREFSTVTLQRKSAEDRWTCEATRVEVTGETPEDPDVRAIVDKTGVEMEKRLAQVAGDAAVPLDGRFITVRTRESNYANLLVDLAREETKTDLVMVNSGTFRCDEIQGPGQLLLGHVLKMLPMPTPILTVEMTGDVVLECLENGVSRWPAKEGRFLQVSGVRFRFDGTAKPGSRILQHTVTVGDDPLDVTKLYRVGVSYFMTLGKDGFDMVPAKSKQIVDVEDAPTLPVMYRNHLRTVGAANGFARRAHWAMEHAVKRFRKMLRNIRRVARRAAGAAVDSPIAPSPIAQPPEFSIAPECDGRIEEVSGTHVPDDPGASRVGAAIAAAAGCAAAAGGGGPEKDDEEVDGDDRPSAKRARIE